MKSALKVASLALLVTGLACAAAPRPNLIVIYTDDHGWPDLGTIGIYPDLRTPRLDALATGGLRATSGYCTAPQCVPSRAGLLTGKAQNRFGVESNGVALEGFNAQQTIAERLKKAGYATGQIGKWHLGNISRITEHGFDDVYAKSANSPGWANYDLDGNTVAGGQENSKLYHLDACSQAARAFIQRHQDGPFFLYLAYRAPHVPLDAPPKYLSRFPGQMPERRRQALAMISAMDDGVGLIMETLRAYGLEENTLIFFIADNGAPLKIHKVDAPGGGPGWDGSLNEPMNGEKGMLTEGGIRVPFLVSWKGTIPAGRVYEHPISTLDVAATALALAGLPQDPSLDGVDLIPFLSGQRQDAPHEVLTWRWIAQSAIREGKWKYLRGGTREYLYDLETDAEEKHNLLTGHPEIARRLRGRLENWASELQPPGLTTKPMAETWERYFDYYLEGKPAPPLRASSGQEVASGTVQGWIARNSTAKIADGALRVTPTPAARQRPFIACARLKMPGPVNASLSIRNQHGGRAGFAWRLDGQRDFPPGQSTAFDLDASPDWQERTVELPVQGTLIHLRVLLPPGTTDLGRISLRSVEGTARQEWNFKSNQKQP